MILAKQPPSSGGVVLELLEVVDELVVEVLDELVDELLELEDLLEDELLLLEELREEELLLLDELLLDVVLLEELFWDELFLLELDGLDVSSLTLLVSSFSLIPKLLKIDSLKLSEEDGFEKREQEEIVKTASTLKQRNFFLFFISETSRSYYIP